MKPSKLPVFLALDVDSAKEALELAQKWSPHLSGFKIGPRLGFKLSESDWKELCALGEIFVDYKFYDIPSTVESAVRAVFEKGATYCTVHAMNGRCCLNKIAKLEKELNTKKPFRVLGVTLLTSFNQEQNALPLVENKEAQKIVNSLAQIVFNSGLTGLVCSSYEVKGLKKEYPQGFFVTPGIRFANDSLEDQSRVATPQEAWSLGSDYLVMGRALINTKDFSKTAARLKAEWQTE